MITGLLFAIGAVLIAEGLVYALAPQLLERVLEMIRDMPLNTRRILGVLMVVIGLILIRLAI
ncbi:MAG: DUF2065 domain-containing protein [Planktomarina sp.]